MNVCIVFSYEILNKVHFNCRMHVWRQILRSWNTKHSCRWRL